MNEPVEITCCNCKGKFIPGDWVIEEMYLGILLPPYHKVGCEDGMEVRNAMRREGTLVYQYHTEMRPECQCIRCKLIRGEPL